MLRYALLFCLALAVPASLAYPAPAAAQRAPKAYAPENLRELRVPERIRVLEKEYAEQSGGRQLPDDQLEFYLDQIESGWSFSRIKEDMARSLGHGGELLGGGGGGNSGHDGSRRRGRFCGSS